MWRKRVNWEHSELKVLGELIGEEVPQKAGAGKCRLQRGKLKHSGRKSMAAGVRAGTRGKPDTSKHLGVPEMPTHPASLRLPSMHTNPIDHP